MTELDKYLAKVEVTYEEFPGPHHTLLAIVKELKAACVITLHELESPNSGMLSPEWNSVRAAVLKKALARCEELVKL